MPGASDTTRERILAAACNEFAAVGFAGARVDAIARAARCNKQLIYHYYQDKQGLYEAVMLDVLSRRTPMTAEPGADMADHFRRRFHELAKTRIWFRLLSWEALEGGGSPIAAEEQRRSHFAAVAAPFEAAQKDGRLDPAMPPRLLLLALMGAATIPLTLPQVARIVTGMDPNAPEFQERYGAMLARLVGRLVPPKA
jgi:AcrR family transcriptional regulator